MRGRLPYHVRRYSRQRGLELKQEITSHSSAGGLQARRFIDDAWPRNPLEEPSVRRWRAAGRTVLLMLLVFSGLQYYFFDVYLTIMALPTAGVLVASS